MSYTLKDPQGKETTITKEQAESYNQGANKLAEGFSVTPNPVPVSSIQAPTNVQLPQQTAPTHQAIAQQGLTAQVQTERQKLDTTLATQKASADKELERVRAEQAKLIEKTGELTTPFRQEVEEAERKRLSVDDNFQANQSFVSELEGLLNQQNALLAYQRGLPLNARASALKTNRTMQDLQARAGVIQAVMSARDNQIHQAYNLIDRSIQAITADRQDGLNYYSMLLNLNRENELALDAESKKFAEEQLNLVKRDLDKAESTAEYIKSLMVDPKTAQFMADAGVTLNDTVEEIKSKMAEQGRRMEITDAKNNLVNQGYEVLPYASSGSFSIEVGGQTIHLRVRPGSELDLDMEYKRSQIAATSSLANQRSGLNMSEYIPQTMSVEDNARLDALGLAAHQKEIVAGIMDGTQPPITTIQRTPEITAILGGLQALGYDNTKAVQDWVEMQNLLKTGTTVSFVRMGNSLQALEGSIMQAKHFYSEWERKGFPSGFSAANMAALKASAVLPGDAGVAARVLISHVEDMTKELATVYKLGNTPTDADVEAARRSINESWNPQQFAAGLDVMGQNARIRMNSLKMSAQRTDNIYNRPEPELQDIMNPGGMLDDSQREVLGMFDEVLGPQTSENSGYFSNLWSNTRGFIGSIFGQ